jgi:hypothetical protein
MKTALKCNNSFHFSHDLHFWTVSHARITIESKIVFLNGLATFLRDIFRSKPRFWTNWSITNFFRTHFLSFYDVLIKDKQTTPFGLGQLNDLFERPPVSDLVASDILAYLERTNEANRYIGTPKWSPVQFHSQSRADPIGRLDRGRESMELLINSVTDHRETTFSVWNRKGTCSKW